MYCLYNIYSKLKFMYWDEFLDAQVVWSWFQAYGAACSNAFSIWVQTLAAVKTNQVFGVKDVSL